MDYIPPEFSCTTLRDTETGTAEDADGEEDSDEEGDGATDELGEVPIITEEEGGEGGCC